MVGVEEQAAIGARTSGVRDIPEQPEIKVPP
jgi:hypothetical protein